MQYGFDIVTRSPKIAKRNGMIEHHVGTIKDMLKKADNPYLTVLTYRTTPLHNGFSPAELLMGRKLRTALPVQLKLLDPKWPDLRKVASREKNIKRKQKQYYVRRHRARSLLPLRTNQNVWVKDQTKTGIVQFKSKFPRSYHVQTDKGIIRRNRRFLSALPEESKSDTNGQNQGCFEPAPKSRVKNCTIIQRKTLKTVRMLRTLVKLLCYQIWKMCKASRQTDLLINWFISR